MERGCAFKQPEGVFIDLDFLKTLPKKQIQNGLGEIIKYGIIKDKFLFAMLEDNIDKIFKLNLEIMEKIIFRCAQIKAKVVEKDEFDKKDIRIILNYGHTLAHAIETATNYTNEYFRGEAVALRMLMASDIAVNLDMFTQPNFDRLKILLIAAGLPTFVKGVSLSKIQSVYLLDKKFTKGTTRFVLPRSIGKVVVVDDLPELLIKSVVKKYVRK